MKPSQLVRRSQEKEQTMQTLLNHLNKRCEVVPYHKQEQQQLLLSDHRFYREESSFDEEENTTQNNNEDSSYKFESMRRRRPQSTFGQLRGGEQVLESDTRRNDYNYASTDIYNQNQQLLYGKRLQEKAKLVQSTSSLNGQLFITSTGVKNTQSRINIPITKDVKYKLTKFEDSELVDYSNSYLREKSEWKDIQEQKKLLQEINQPYFEDIQTFNLRFTKKDSLRNRHQKQKLINENLNSFAHSKTSHTKKQSMSILDEKAGGYYEEDDEQVHHHHRRNSSLNKQSSQSLSQQQGNFKNFNKMSIYELKQHEKGILNLYDSQTQRKVTHNKNDSNSGIFDIKLSQFEYDSIFDNPPTFEEKKAFIEVFRKKWKEDKGYCSLFDKRQLFKNAIQSKRLSQNNLIEENQIKKRPMSSMAAIAKIQHKKVNKQQYQSQNNINVTGSPAKFHNPIQNNEDSNLTNFIQQLYQPKYDENEEPPKKQEFQVIKVNPMAKKRIVNSNTDTISATNIKEYKLNEDIVKESLDSSLLITKDQHQKSTGHDQNSVNTNQHLKITTQSNGKQIISLPTAAQQRATTSSQPFSPYSQNLISHNESQRLLPESQRIGAESDKDGLIDGASQQYLINKKIRKNNANAIHNIDESNNKTSFNESQGSIEDPDNQSIDKTNQNNKVNEQKVPSIFTLPQNPIAYSYFKYNFVKNKIENNRLQNLSQVHMLQFKLDKEQIQNKNDMKRYQDQLDVYTQNNTSATYNTSYHKKQPRQVTLQKRVNQRNKTVIIEYEKKHDKFQKQQTVKQGNTSQHSKRPISSLMYNSSTGVSRPTTSQAIFSAHKIAEIDRNVSTSQGYRRKKTTVSNTKKINKEVKVIELGGKLVGESKTQSTVTHADLTQKNSLDFMNNYEMTQDNKVNGDMQNDDLIDIKIENHHEHVVVEQRDAGC